MGAFSDLEDDVCKLGYMAAVADLTVHHGIGESAVGEEIDEESRDSIMFAVRHLREMVDAFQDKYYEAFKLEQKQERQS
jgi:hypothetical protein